MGWRVRGLATTVAVMLALAWMVAACGRFEAKDPGLATTADQVVLGDDLPGEAPPAGTAVAAAASATTAPTPTATATAVPLPPLAIASMRARDYPGSDLVVEQDLPSGASYRRQLVSYLSDGLKIYALLTIPNGERPATGWPIVVFNHGYIPPAQYRTTERYVAYVDAFARNGYMVLKSDYRGHGSSEGAASGGYGSPDYTTDVLNGMASVIRHPEADPERVGMWGHSMGGHITLRSMVVSPSIRAGVIWAGVVASYPDLFSRWRRATPTAGGAATPTPVPWRRRWRDDFVARYGSPEDNPEFWAAISPNSYLADLSGPIQLHHGSADRTVPMAFSEQLHQQMEAVGMPVEYFAYEANDHNLSQSLSLALQRSVAFFDRHVKGAEGGAAEGGAESP